METNPGLYYYCSLPYPSHCHPSQKRKQNKKEIIRFSTLHSPTLYRHILINLSVRNGRTESVILLLQTLNSESTENLFVFACLFGVFGVLVHATEFRPSPAHRFTCHLFRSPTLIFIGLVFFFPFLFRGYCALS